MATTAEAVEALKSNLLFETKFQEVAQKVKRGVENVTLGGVGMVCREDSVSKYRL